MTRRNACGKTTNLRVWKCDSPRDRAAARWLGCTVKIPLRKTSATDAHQKINRSQAREALQIARDVVVQFVEARIDRDG